MKCHTLHVWSIQVGNSELVLTGATQGMLTYNMRWKRWKSRIMKWYIHLSPCFRLMNISGNSCLHAHPNTAVSSSALYRLDDLKISPARKLLHDCIMKNNMHIYTGIYILDLVLTLSCFCPFAPATCSSTASWSLKNRLPCRGCLWLCPADFFLGSLNRASIERIKLPFSYNADSTVAQKQLIVTTGHHSSISLHS